MFLNFRLMTNRLMSKLNMQGSRGTKLAFGDMAVCEMIVGKEVLQLHGYLWHFFFNF